MFGRHQLLVRMAQSGTNASGLVPRNAPTVTDQFSGDKPASPELIRTMPNWITSESTTRPDPIQYTMDNESKLTK
jgi:hypothetical protein